MANHYHFITRWRVKGTPDEIFEILSQPLEYPRWWPAVWVTVREIAPGRVRFLTRGRLPYKLRWQATSQTQRPNRIVVHATGDFEGRGIWSIVRNEDFTDVTFDWKLTAEKPLLRFLSPIFRPAFEANHRWAMGEGLKSLNLELARYRSANVQDLSTTPLASVSDSRNI